MKERIVIPDRLRGRVEKLVRARMAAAKEDEGLARATVEQSLLLAGVVALERKAAHEIDECILVDVKRVYDPHADEANSPRHKPEPRSTK